MRSSWEIGVMIWIAIGLVTFLSLFFLRVTAPFGRHTRTDWGPMINNSFGWFLMEIPSLACLWIGFFVMKSDQTPTLAWLPFALYSIHYINRSFIYPNRLRNKDKQMPLVITFSAVFFNLVNGTVNGVFLGSGWFLVSPTLAMIGTVIFLVGMGINMKADNMLINLRKPGEKHYVIPKGFLFDRVSSPNLFGEIIEWIGFAILAPGWASLSFLVWTVANLIPRARDHHEWYHEKFPDYPKSRKVLIPGVW